jgi:hypothetical protein
MRVEVATVGVEMTDRDGRAESNIYEEARSELRFKSNGRDTELDLRTSVRIGHAVALEGVLELRTHEAISLARSVEDPEVDPAKANDGRDQPDVLVTGNHPLTED